MNELQLIQSKIYEIRGQKVMLDRDLAELYGVETRMLNQAVKRNIERFPEDFMFQMTDTEVEIWKSQIVISMGIMRAFVTIRHMIAETSPLKRLSALEKNFNELKQDLEEIFADYNDINEDTRAQIEAINTTLAELQARPANRPRRPVGFIKPKE